MSRFSFTARWVPGKENVEADALSRSLVGQPTEAYLLGEGPTSYTSSISRFRKLVHPRQDNRSRTKQGLPGLYRKRKRIPPEPSAPPLPSPRNARNARTSDDIRSSARPTRRTNPKSKCHSNSSRTASTSTSRRIGPPTTSPSHPPKTSQEHAAHSPATQAVLPQNGLTSTIPTPCRGNKLKETPTKQTPPHPIPYMTKRMCV